MASQLTLLVLAELLANGAAQYHADYSYSTFTYPAAISTQYATPLASPVSFPSSFAQPFSKVSTLLDPSITYTAYSLNPDATKTRDGRYGQSAYASLWANASVTYSVRPPFTTTMSPTSIPQSELVYPPDLPVVPADSIDTCEMTLPSDFVWGVSIAHGKLKVASKSKDEDIMRLAAIGIPYLSFSIPWTRIIPFGVADSPVNKQALDHYEDLIDTAIEHGVTPIVTILHFDLPLSVPYSDPNFSDHFLYAKQVMTRFGDRVPYWVTMNEPNLQPVDNALTHIPTAHANLYDWYKNELRGTGKLTMKFANNLGIPLNADNATDISAAQRYQDFILGIMNNPLFLGTQISTTVLNTTGIKINALTPSQLALISGKIDFFSFDPYSAQYITSRPDGTDACAADTNYPHWPTCVVTTSKTSTKWLIGNASSVSYSFIAPQYVRAQLNYVWNTFRPAGVLVAEFGFPAIGDTLRSLDQRRLDLE